MEPLKEVWEDLCDEQFLSRCLLGATQNQNESCNRLIWDRSTKTEFTSRATADSAVSQSILVFNGALLPIMERLELNSGPCRDYLTSEYTSPIKRAARDTAMFKERRKSKKNVEAAFIEEEGITYEPGGF